MRKRIRLIDGWIILNDKGEWLEFINETDYGPADIDSVVKDLHKKRPSETIIAYRFVEEREYPKEEEMW